jgi:hypothetical protein
MQALYAHLPDLTLTYTEKSLIKIWKVNFLGYRFYIVWTSYCSDLIVFRLEKAAWHGFSAITQELDREAIFFYNL